MGHFVYVSESKMNEIRAFDLTERSKTVAVATNVGEPPWTGCVSTEMGYLIVMNAS